MKSNRFSPTEYSRDVYDHNMINSYCPGIPVNQIRRSGSDAIMVTDKKAGRCCSVPAATRLRSLTERMTDRTMTFFDKLFSRSDINASVEEFRNTPGAYLIDVRTGPEYEAGHIEGSINVPLHSIHFIVNHVRDIHAPLFVYCQSGARSGQATSMIKEMGYKNVKNIGGVNRYKGKLVR